MIADSHAPQREVVGQAGDGSEGPPPAPCQHAYHVAPLCGIATGQPCARCGEPYDPKANR